MEHFSRLMEDITKLTVAKVLSKQVRKRKYDEYLKEFRRIEELTRILHKLLPDGHVDVSSATARFMSTYDYTRAWRPRRGKWTKEQQLQYKVIKDIANKLEEERKDLLRAAEMVS